MDDKEFDQKLVEKIQTAKLSPKPRWYFLLKNYVIWAAGILALLGGALAVSVMIYLFRYNNWEMMAGTNKSLIEFLLSTMPYFWIIFSGAFIFIVYYNLKHTKKGYRYPVGWIITFGFIATIILGSAFYLLGIGQKIDNILGEKTPFYGQVFNRQMDFWFNPAEGRLVGVVASDVVDDSFRLVDPSGQAWLILNKNNDQERRSAEFLRVGQPINLVGIANDKNTFEAKIIKPLIPGKGVFSRPEIKEHRRRCLESDCLLPPPPPVFIK